VDGYALASPWSGFANIAFQNGSGAIGGIPDGALGAMVGGFLSEHFYLVGGFADANGDPTNLDDGFDSLFNDFETFKSLELGWATTHEDVFQNNAHLTFWQIDKRNEAGTPNGWGTSFSLSASLDNGWMPFLRGGWAKDGGSLYEASVTTGLGYTLQPGQTLLGAGFNWNRPNKSTYGASLSDQYSLELFQQVQLTEGFEITPSVQFIRNPALESSDDWSVFFGLRLRVAL